MKYSPSESGHFDGQRGYGYISIEKFIDAARSVNAGETKASDYDKHGLPTISNTILTTAILHAGRISLDKKRPVYIKQNKSQWALEVETDNLKQFTRIAPLSLGIDAGSDR